ncbi:hypothetical protein MMC29_007560 [Sticta canariensis]|nr:hypothetical protein [Sticta canariensis]
MDQIDEGNLGRPKLDYRDNTNENTCGSIATRIRHSSSGLISNSFSRPGPSSVISSLASFSGEGSKGGSVFASTVSSELASSSALQSSQYSSFHTNQPNSLNAATELENVQSWKIHGNNNSCQSAFEESLSQETPRMHQRQQGFYTFSESNLNTSYHNSNKLRQRDGKSCNAVPPELASIWSSVTIRPTSGRHLDGAAVVAILRDPEFSPVGDLEHLTLSTEDFETSGDDVPRVCPLPGLKPSTLCAPSSVTIDTSFSNDKSSIASGGVLKDTVWAEPDRSYHPTTADGELLSWLKNFKSYQDEVWGNMSNPAGISREKSAAQRNGPEIVRKQCAAKRLAMILRHVDQTIKRK